MWEREISKKGTLSFRKLLLEERQGSKGGKEIMYALCGTLTVFLD